MRKVVNYKGKDYYSFREFQEIHPHTKYIDQRKEFLDSVFCFHAHRLITKETWEAYEKALYYDDMYSKSAAGARLLGDWYHSYWDEDAERMLMNCIPYEKNNEMIYFSKQEVDDLDNISGLLSKITGLNLISYYDLIRYHNKNRLLHADLLILSEYHIDYLYPRRRIVDVEGWKAIRVNNKSPFEEFKDLLEASTPIDFWNNYFDGSVMYGETLSVLREFYVYKINASASAKRDRLAKEYVSLCYDFYNCLSCEIYLYSNQEIKLFLEDHPKFAKSKYIIQFIEFVRNKYDGFLSGVNDFRMQANNTRPDYQEAIYTAEEFTLIYDAAIDYTKHIQKAYEDYTYAQYWLVVLLLVSNFIRTSDIINVPIIEYPYEFQYGYFLHNKIQLHEAQAICNFFEITAGNIKINKSGEKKKIRFLQDQIEAVAIALSICNEHAKEKKLPRLFSISAIQPDRIYAKMGEPFYDVGNRKMNYTLATYFEETGNEASEYRRDVYRLLSFMRGHKTKDLMLPSQTTLIYIKAANQDLSPSEIAYHTISRGAFGWLYHLMLNYAEDKYESLDEETKNIKKLRTKYNPQNMEVLAEYLLHEQQIRRNVLEQLKFFNKGQIRDFLYNMGNSLTVKNNRDFPCILGKNCPRKGGDCAFCEYSIKTTHSLGIYRDEINRIINVLQTTNNQTEIKKNMYLIFKILLVIKEFKQEFDEYDKDYLSAYIDIKEIVQKLDAMPTSFIYMLEEVLNGESNQE